MDKVISSPKKLLNQLLLAAIILSLGFGQLLRFELATGLTLYLHDPLIIIYLLLNLLELFKENTRLIRLISYFAAAASISLLLSTKYIPLAQVGFNSLYFARLLAYLLLLPTLPHSIARERVSSLLLISGTLTLLIGLVQYFFLPDTRYLYYLGWDDHLNRLIFPHYDPTFTGAIIALTLLLSMKLKTKLPTILALPALLLTYSRSIFISLIPPLLSKNKKYLIIAAVVLVGILFLPEKFGEGTNLLRTYSIQSRATHDTKVLRIFADSNLLFGVGMNNLSHYLSPSDLPNHATTANNSYVYLLATTGILGTFLFLKLLHALYKRSSHKQLLFFILLASMFNNILFYPFTLLWLVFLSTPSKHKR